MRPSQGRAGGGGGGGGGGGEGNVCPSSFKTCHFTY